MIAKIYKTDELKGTINPPSSKNYTTRYILVSCLSEGESVVKYPAKSDDADAMISCCKALGAKIDFRDDALYIKGFGNKPADAGVVNPQNAGTVLRLLLAVGAFLPKVRFETEYKDSLGTRPNGDLLDALAQMGVKCEADGGRLPITLYGGNLKGGKIKVSGKTSSQYLSALLFIAPLVEEDIEIEVIEDLKSKPLIRTTLAVMKEAGIEVNASDDLMNFSVKGGQKYATKEYIVPGDYPGSSAIMCAATVMPRADVKIVRMSQDDEQGEKATIDVLKNMGVDITHVGDIVHIKGNGKLTAVEFEGDKATDAVLAMSGAACLAEGTTHFYNVENLRYKECDRISDFLSELKKVGVITKETKSEIFITGNPSGYDGGIEVEAHNDHRVIMALTILGMRCRNGLTIKNAHHISKSYPKYFDDLISLGAKIEL